jgi:Ser/Thr protein kinase RdoA (MazF antagonist)
VTTLGAQVEARFGLRDVRVVPLGTAANDVFSVTAGADAERFALKLYHGHRTVEDVRWEVELVAHLRRHGAPVMPMVAGAGGEVVYTYTWNGETRIGVVSAWAPGAKPQPVPDTFVLLGEAAARIHAAGDSLPLPPPSRRYDAAVLVDEQFTRMRAHLEGAGRWADVVELGARLKARIADPRLDRGICHIDLTLDNVHRDGDELFVFDLDSAGWCWRAFEPYRVLLDSPILFRAWLEGYRAVRPFSARDEAAVVAFSVIGDLRTVAWNLGVAESSRGAPTLDVAALDGIVDGWLARGG